MLQCSKNLRYCISRHLYIDFRRFDEIANREKRAQHERYYVCSVYVCTCVVCMYECVYSVCMFVCSVYVWKCVCMCGSVVCIVMVS